MAGRRKGGESFIARLVPAAFREREGKGREETRRPGGLQGAGMSLSSQPALAGASCPKSLATSFPSTSPQRGAQASIGLHQGLVQGVVGEEGGRWGPREGGLEVQGPCSY